MSSFDDLLAQVPIAQIASKLGVDEKTATNAVVAALPTLLGGLQANANKPEYMPALADEATKRWEQLDGA
ncbi:DUF937 domain-containing protein [Kitasatospora sp. NPDC096077]|uniref:DUF937 domain-containing protein n=1 Tax=Kitasatospora sp. NPDC096077 TaxID=3155544 RepID=UPI00331851DD